MKKGFVFLFLIAILASTYYGLRTHFGMIDSLAPPKKEGSIQARLRTVHPILEDQMIVAIVLAENDSKDIERSLDSLFKQSYPHVRVILIDNGSTDGTYERAEAYAKNQEKEIELIRHTSHRPRLEVLYEVIGHLDPHDVVTLIEGKDWLSHENVFDHLNCAYANPDVWMTHSRAISHPDYHEVMGAPFTESDLVNKEVRQKTDIMIAPLLSFYAGFFQSVKLQDCLFQGTFIDDCYRMAMVFPLLEMGPEHLLFMDEVSYVQNDAYKHVDHQMHLQKIAVVESHLRSLHPYPTLSQLKLTGNSPSFHRYKADVILFSEDSPLHCYACLESLFAQGRDLNEVYILYKGTDSEFQRAYLNLQNEFHTASFLNICDYPGNDYATLISKVLSNRIHASPYVAILDDSLIFEERIRFHDCIAAMEKVHADHFFLSNDCEDNEGLSPAISIAQGIYAYQLGEKERPFTPALFRKSLFGSLEGIETLSAFQKLCLRKLSPASAALFFEEKKVLPIALEQDAAPAKKKEWSHKFIEGYKIDLSSLTCELDALDKGELPLIKRDRHRRSPSQD